MNLTELNDELEYLVYVNYTLMNIINLTSIIFYFMKLNYMMYATV